MGLGSSGMLHPVVGIGGSPGCPQEERGLDSFPKRSHLLRMNDLSSKNRTQPGEEALGGRVLSSRQAWASGEICARRQGEELVGRERRALCRWWGPEMVCSREVFSSSVPCLRDSAVFLPSSPFPHLPICPDLPSCSLHLSLSRRVSREAAERGPGGCSGCTAGLGRLRGLQWLISPWV